MLVVSWGLLAGVRALGYEVNFSRSMPIGLYVVAQDSLYRGQMVAACLPAAVSAFGQARGYLQGGTCDDGSAPVLKRIVAMEGDVVDVGEREVRVNGLRAENSGTRTHDRKGRALPHWEWGTFEMKDGHVWLMGTEEFSWDSRYFGPVPIVNVVATAQIVVVAVPSGVLP